MNCKYRNCNKELPEKVGAGRNKAFCNSKCKSMEQYHKTKYNNAVNEKRETQGEG